MELEKSAVNSRQQREILAVVWTYLKIILLIGVNVVVFLPIPPFILWILFGVEFLIGSIIKLNLDKILPILKFLAINLIPLYIVLFFVDRNWLNALYYLGEYASKIFVLLLSVILFSQTTSTTTLIMSFARIGVPRRISFILITILTCIPIGSSQLRLVVKAQKARGYRFRLFNLKPILVPAILNLLDLSVNLALSIESRGFEV